MCIYTFVDLESRYASVTFHSHDDATSQSQIQRTTHLNNDVIAARSCYGETGACAHEKIQKNKAIWCVLVYTIF